MSIAGDNARRLRLSKGMTLKEVASLAGISIGLLGDIESGRTNPSLKTAEKLAKVFQITLGELVDKQEEDLSPLDSWKEAPDFPKALLVISELQDMYNLSSQDCIKMAEEAAKHFDFRLPRFAPDAQAAHVEGPAALGGSGIMEKAKRKKIKLRRD